MGLPRMSVEVVSISETFNAGESVEVVFRMNTKATMFETQCEMRRIITPEEASSLHVGQVYDAAFHLRKEATVKEVM